MTVDPATDPLLQQAFAAAVGKRVSDAFLAEDLRKMVDTWFATTGGQAYRGFVSADAMWAAIDPAARPFYGRPISEVPLGSIYRASPAELNVGNVPELVLDGLAGELAKVAMPVAVLLGIVGIGLLGVRMIFAPSGDKLVIPLVGGGRKGFRLR